MFFLLKYSQDYETIDGDFTRGEAIFRDKKRPARF